MYFDKLAQRYIKAIIVLGCACVLSAVVWLPYRVIDLNFLVLFALTIGVGSRISVPIPRFKSHISVSDTFIFLALLMYGGEVAIILSAIEAFFSSWRFCNRKLTVFFNAAAVAVSTSFVYLALRTAGLYSFEHLHGETSYLQNLAAALSTIALTQFLSNTTLASLHDALKDGIPLWETWKSKYAWSFITYFVGAASAGLLHLLADSIGFGVIVAVFPVIFFIFMTYRMYLKNVEMSIEQAEQAEQYARILEEQSGALRESEERFRSAFNHAPIGIALVSAGGTWLKVNHALCSILGYSEEDLVGNEFQDLIFQDDLGATLVKIHELLSGKAVSCQMEQRYLHRSGRTVWTSWSVSAASDLRSNIPNLIFQLQDITDKKIAEEKLQHEATHDGLTGLPNRKLFMSRLSEALASARVNSNYRVSVLFIDLDRFKFVNDSLGHLVGDQLLVRISERLRECLRPSDIVARLGGDEFTILVAGNYENEEVIRIAERIQEKFGIPFDLDGHEVFSSASIGILHASANHSSAEEMMRDADTAMYQAKRSGKARHEVFDERMHLAAREILQIETDLRRAIENNEIYLTYQPIFSLETGRMSGIEALTRWRHPKLGEIAPDRFIAIAEEIGLIGALGEHILRQACSETVFLLRSLTPETSIELSVNLSCRQFAQPDLVNEIARILADTGFPAGSLRLEITESIFFEYQEKATEMLTEVRGLGIEIDIDDFGTGYSNLGYLIKLPISRLKIDRSFVEPIDKDGNNTGIVRTVLSLARNLGLTAVAEGIEHEHQASALKDMGCHSGQGYYFARPMRIDELKRYMAELEGNEFLRIPMGDVPVVETLQ